MNSAWRRVSKADPCPVCGHGDWCKLSADGAVALCGRIEQGSFQAAKAGGGWLHRLIDRPRPDNGNGRTHRPTPRPAARPVETQADWRALYERLAGQMDADRLAELAAATGTPAAAWAILRPGWATAQDLRDMRAGGAGWAENYPTGAWAFAERSGDGRVVGLSLRAPDGRKGAPAGAKRGLIVPTDLHQRPDPVLVVEGASDVAACAALNLPAVGRPSNRGGAEDLAILLDGRRALIVGERDGKPDGAWPGRDGAKAVAQQLAGRWHDPVRWTLPPVGAKDVRDWLRARIASGLDPADAQAMHAAGAELLAALEADAKEAKADKRSQADALVDMALRDFRVGMSTDGDAFAVPNDGPQVAMMFRAGASGLRAALAKRYRAVTGKTPSASALADALVALEGMAQDATPEPVALRLAEHGDGVALDLADGTGRAAVITPGGWAVVAVSPVLFRHSALTAPLPEPEQAEPAALLELRALLNVGDNSWPLVAGWLVAALLPIIPHPIAMFGGEQGTGKSSAARVLVRIIDPSTAEMRSEPKDPEQWAIAAAGCWLVALDNLSRISAWLSDALCKAVTGDGVVRRKLWTDSDLAVLQFRRCIIITAIDVGALRGDLGDRLLVFDLVPIPDTHRRTEAELGAQTRAILPRALGGLLSAVARVLAVLPDVRLDRMPRMADFARVLAALDRACPELTGGRALELFAGQRQRIAGEVVESDPVASAIVRLTDGRTVWTGTAAELLAAITPTPTPKHWPGSARGLVGHLRRVRPALAAVGIDHEPPPEHDKTRTHRIEKRGAQPPEPPEPPSNPAAAAAGAILPGLNAGGSYPQPPEPPDNRPGESRDCAAPEAISGGMGGMGGTAPVTSAGAGARQRGRL